MLARIAELATLAPAVSAFAQKTTYQTSDFLPSRSATGSEAVKGNHEPEGVHVVRAYLLTAVLGLPGLGLAPSSAVHASSTPADSVRFCAFDDYEHWRHPRPPAKRLADLNVGQPRTVRIVYFLPTDWSYRADVVDSMKTVIRQAQAFYGEQMQAHGYGDWTFRIETDAQGEPLVHRVDGQHPFSHYDNTLGNAVVAELEQTFDLDANIYVIILGADALRQGNGQLAGGVGRRRTKNGGALVVPNWFSFLTVAHELGHAFGLYHDYRDNRYIMSDGGLQRSSLSECAAEFLSVNAFFNPAVSIAEGPPPTVELISPSRYPPRSTSIPVRLRLSDPEGLHQVGLIGNEQWCRGLAGQKEADVEFDFDGQFLSGRFSALVDSPMHPLVIVAVDTNGNVNKTNSSLTRTSPYEIGILRGDAEHLASVIFSPVGTILAAVPWGSGSFILWDASTRERVGILDGAKGMAAAFSPDGALLATGYQLWDVARRKQIATLEGRPDGIQALAFSSAGTLASGSWDGTVQLWDVASGKEIASLKGHEGQIHSVAFSPDGTLLASGSGVGNFTNRASVRLWNAETLAEIAIPEDRRGTTVEEVAFSPDGKWLIWSSWQPDRVTAWDVESRETRFDLEGATFAISRDSAILASVAGAIGAITLWETANPSQEIITLPDAFHSRELSFSPDGTILAAGSWAYGTITLWDVSEWAGLRPFTLEIVSGDRQRGTPGAALGQPLVVEVRDQHGDLMPDAVVTFTVTAGVGKLSGRFSVEHTTTDATGRAELPLTLGLHPGPNTVGVSIAGRDVATFHAEGVGTAVAELEGDYRTWHLPGGATARLGKGTIGESHRAVALSFDGRCLAVATDIGVWLYEVATSRAQALLPSKSPVNSVAFSLDGALAAGLDNGGIELWAVETGERIGTLGQREAGPRSLNTVVFSPDGTALASGFSKYIKLWDVEARRQIGSWEVGEAPFWGIPVAFSPDGSRLASGFLDGTVRLWEMATQMEVASLEGHTGQVTAVSFSPDGAFLASAGGPPDRTVRLWDVSAHTRVTTLRGHSSDVRSMSFSSPDGALLAWAGGRWGHTVWLWKVATRELIPLREQTGPAHSVTFSPDGVTLVSGGADGAVWLRDVETGNAAGLSGHAYLSSMTLSPDGALLASGHPDGTVWLWDAATRTRTASLEGQSEITSLSFSPDGRTLASGSDRTVKLWKVETREEIGTLQGHTFRVTSVSFSPDGTTLASAAWGDATVRLWDVGTRQQIGILEDDHGGVRSVAFSSTDGGLLASAGWRVKLWDVTTRELIGTLGEPQGFRSVAFSPDGSILASGTQETGTQVWEVATRIPISTLGGDGPVAFSPDGSRLASGFLDGTVRLWEMATQREVASLEGHTGWIHSVAFAPDGTLVSGAYDGTMLLWDLGPFPRTLTRVPGRRQQGPAGAVLAEPFVVRVLDQNGFPLAGAKVTFSVTEGGGTLSVESATTDANGRASTTLTLGSQPGANTVEASVAGLESVIFTATAEATPDFNGDGVTDFSDFFLFAEAFGGSDPRFDLDGSGSVDFVDFFLFAESFGQPARAKLVALARGRLGLPDGRQLQQNAPNPFNSGTVISWFQLQAGPARLEVYALTGQRVAALHEGPKKAGLHRLRWDGRDEQGRPLASGVYVYRLVTAEGAQTRKLTLLR